MKTKLLLAGLIGLSASPLLAHPPEQHAAPVTTAQAQPMNHGQMNHAQMGSGQMMNHDQMMRNTPANPYAEAEMRMHQRMMSAAGANADETWARKMIEHHRGAIETGQILMARGRDARLKQMARRSMAEQQKEINELQAWLRQRGRRPQ